MTSKDKTGDQLVASIRKTKQAATKSDKPTTTRRSQPKKKAAKPAPAADAAKATPAAPAKPAAKKTTSRRKPAAGNYQSGRRVWPD